MRTLVLASVALLASACALGPSYGNLKPGVSRTEVLKVMGCPATDVKKDGYEAITFTARMPTFFQWGPADYAYIFKDGVLVEGGRGSVREEKTATGAKFVFVPPAGKATASTSAATCGAS